MTPAFRPWNPETAAIGVLEQVLGGTGSVCDPGGGASPIHDIDFTCATGRRIAVEVTIHGDERALARYGAIDKIDWSAPSLRFDWHVGVIDGTRVKDLRARVEPLLAALEAEGTRSVVLSPAPYHGELPYLRGLRGLGIRLAYDLGPPDAHRQAVIDVGDSSRVGSTGWSLVTSAVLHHACLADNQRKLEVVVDAERHLFVWVSTTAHALIAALDGRVGSRLDGHADNFDLPPWVDCVWVATSVVGPRVLSYSREGWVDYGRLVPNDGFGDS